MKKLIFVVVFGICSWAAFAQAITFKVASYQISRRQAAPQYTKAELVVNDNDQSWEIILYRKDGAVPERIKLEKFDDIGHNLGVFRTITIQEAAGTSGSNLFAYMPVFDGNKIRVDLCDTRTEGVKRRLIIEYI
ncbi:hypothetical protein AGMMS50230_04330 [Spirochaetia bacterium]|nr:hypothetical protein AGMMS50230_04330 [Spirochaetia bacterium]